MKKLPLLICIALYATWTIPCNAKLGDTIDQCIKEYGNPLHPIKSRDSSIGKTENVDFKSNRYLINVSFIKGLAFIELIRKSDLKAFTDAEIDQIFQNEGGTWNPLDLPEKAKEAKGWNRQDGADAVYIIKDCTLCLTLIQKKLD